VIEEQSLEIISLELLRALESVKIQLALAIAAERKFTPLDRRQYYLETAGRMNQCVKKLKKDRTRILSPEGKAWAMEAINGVSQEIGAGQICLIIGNIIAELERTVGEESSVQ